jgi:regulator of sirC expression with transglutaminase-like and TPR domain
MHTRAFRAELDRSPVDLTRAALLFAQSIAYPNLDVNAYLARLDWLAEMAGQVVPRRAFFGQRADALAEFLFKNMDFRGNQQDYADPRNSYLNDVLDRRLGIPISLSAIFLAVARRLHLAASGVGLPGHFIVSVREGARAIYLDPFHQGIRLTVEDCARLVQQTTDYGAAGPAAPFRREWLEPSPPHAILARMLNNLRNIYIQQQQWNLAVRVLAHLRLVQPAVNEHIRDLGLVYQQMGELRQAVDCLEQYLLRAPQAQDARQVRSHLNSLAGQLARLN